MGFLDRENLGSDSLDALFESNQKRGFYIQVAMYSYDPSLITENIKQVAHTPVNQIH